MPKLTIDGREIEVEAGLTVLQACEQVGIEIPRFCYHERLSVAGNCRMCLVEMERAPKPVASCAMPVGEGMVIHTNSPKVKKMREGVMEFLLANHPLDCPICDQGGECDLQDQAMAFGSDRSRFKEMKRAVEEKYMGPLIKTIMTRCIHCTRCIRFTTEVAGVPELGAVARGEKMEVTTYIDKALSSELSGCVVDLCPVGALTSGPYAFIARPWELKKTESVDVMDAVGSNIRIDARGNEVMRILPVLNEDVNEEWISDKARHIVDGLKRQRLDKPYLRKDGKLQPAEWDEALAAAGDKLAKTAAGKVAAIVGDTVDCESMTALKLLFEQLGSPNIDCRQDGTKLTGGVRASYLFNATINGIERADAVLIIGSNPRREAPVLNQRIRKRWLAGPLPVGVIGEQADLTYEYDYLGAGGDTLADVAAGKHPFAKVLKDAKHPMLILGQGALSGDDGAAVLAAAKKIADDCGMVDKGDGWNGFSVLHTSAARVGGLDLGLVPGAGGKDVAGILNGAASGDIEVVYLLAADEIDTDKLKNAFVIYQGHHGDAGAMVADVILPGATYTEKDATYVNTEGRPQRARLAVHAPGEAKEDWKIIRALSAVAGKTIAVDTLEQVRAKMVDINAAFLEIGSVKPADWQDFGQEGKLGSDPYRSPITNFYMTDPISRTSATMAKCTQVIGAAGEEKTGTDG